MRVLIGCESSGVVREAFRALGHDAWSCDLLPADDGSPFHYQCDVREVVGMGWDFAGFHPSCQYLTAAGLHWNQRVPGRAEQTERDLEFVRYLLSLPIPRMYLENPVGAIGTRIRPADQYIQPYQFGEDASKRTGLWLTGLDPLVIDPARFVAPRMVDGRPRWSNQTDSGQNKLAPSPDRWKLRSITYPGIAAAMAEQWGKYS